MMPAPSPPATVHPNPSRCPSTMPILSAFPSMVLPMSLTQPRRIYPPWKPGCLAATGTSGDVSRGPRSSHLARINPRQAQPCQRLHPPRPERAAALTSACTPAARRGTEGQRPSPESSGTYLVCIAELGHLVSMVEGLQDERRVRSLPSREVPEQDMAGLRARLPGQSPQHTRPLPSNPHIHLSKGSRSTCCLVSKTVPTLAGS